jgi:hypothetical protein
MPNGERDAVCAATVSRRHRQRARDYHALPTSMTNRVLVQLDCATHAMMWEGCSNTRLCIPASGIPYGGPPDRT